MIELVFAEIIRFNRIKAQTNETIEEILYELGTPPGMRYDKIRVQSTPQNRMESMIVKLETLKAKAYDADVQIDARMGIIEEIQHSMNVYTSDEWKVIECRYWKGYSLKRTEDETGFSFRKVRRLVGRIKRKNLLLDGGILDK